MRRPLDLYAFLVVFFIVWTLRATIFYDSVDTAIDSPIWRAVFSQSIKFSLWVLPAAAFAYWVRRANPFQYLGLASMPTARQWAFCAAVTLVFLAIVALVDITLDGKSLSLAPLTGYLSIAGVLGLIVSPLIEEILFRGLVLKEFAERMPGWAANIAASILFAAVHAPYWFWNEGVTTAVMTDLAGVFIVSLVIGWIYLRTRSVWAAFAAHAANNLWVSLLVK